VLDLRRDDGSLDFRAAKRWLKGEELPPEPPPASIEVEVSDVIAPRSLVLPAGAVVAPIESWIPSARRYLVEERRVPPEQADRWRLGYAATGRLAGRIVFPIRDRSGALRGYQGRSFTGDRLKWRSASSAEPGVDRDALFGEEHWPAPSDRSSVVVTEAALDALAAEEATDRRRSVCAIYGSEPTGGHLERLSTFPEVLVASDPDDAGERLWEALRAGLARWTRVKRVALPEGSDCSALWRRDPASLRALLAP
jgi:DNA primase